MRGSLIAVSACAAAVAAATLELEARGAAPREQYAYTETSKVVYDNYTKLTWQRQVSPEPYTRSDAVDYCAKLNLEEGHLWRVPEMRELTTLVDVHVLAPSIDRAAFPSTPTEPLWSANEVADGSSDIWTADFRDGSSRRAKISEKNRVRCVAQR